MGTGIALGGHLTPQARLAIERADVVMCLLADAVAVEWLRRLRPDLRSLHELFRVGEERSVTYALVAEEIAGEVRRGQDVCAVFYGHPGVLVDPAHDAIRRVRAEGLPARMLPAVSAADCLVADLQLDPGRSGWQMYDATDFLLRARRFDPTAALVLWQIAAIGATRHGVEAPRPGLPLVVERLQPAYGEDHRVILYEASPYPVANAAVTELTLAQLGDAEPSPAATLYVPPLAARVVDETMRERLGLA